MINPKTGHKLQFKDLKGQTFARLTVLQHVGKDKFQNHLWLCECVCGAKTTVVGSSLRAGHTTSCGCYKKEVAAAISRDRCTTHGHTTDGERSPEYTTRCAMIQRCTNPNNASWVDYGARGISVCKRWLKSFENFLADMGPKPEPKHLYSIERIDNDGNYKPSNCQWATAKEQALNRRPRRDRIQHSAALPNEA